MGVDLAQGEAQSALAVTEATAPPESEARASGDAPIKANHGAATPAAEDEPCGAMLHYDVELRWTDGEVQRHKVGAPNELTSRLADQPALSPTGWLRLVDDKGRVDTNGPYLTEYQHAFSAIVETVSGHGWGGEEPYFERLEIRVDIPGLEVDLGVGDEVMSTFEAMHEDIYFSLLEFFQHHSGRALGDRRLQPGQIIPDVRPGAREAHVRMSTERFEPVKPIVLQAGGPSLDHVAAPLETGRIAVLLNELGGESFSALSRQGRPVLGRYLRGPGPAVLISGAQHANETSGVVGALRAAQVLAHEEDAHFALIAVENPDGYALHERLRVQNPRHMHHAARYSALGDDIAYRETLPQYELAARHQALALSGAALHINLHGYPAHEWTRPLSGYLPRRFEAYTLPRGFFLVLRFQPAWAARATRLIEDVTRRLAKMPGLLAFNERQLALFHAHAQETGFDLINGIPVLVAQSAAEWVPISLITEFPDETIYGEPFLFAHSIQLETVLAAVQAYRAMAD